MMDTSGLPHGRPKSTKLDWLAEAAAVAGLLAGLTVIAYGGATQPEIVPTHIGYGGIIDSHGSKWISLALFAVAMSLNYGLLTIVGWYLGRHVTADATGEKARGTYRIGQAISRWTKLAFAWVLVVLSGWYVAVIPGNPKLALGAVMVLVLLLMPMLAYTFIAFVVPPMANTRYNGMSKMLRK